jgi:hypothetical protein
MITNPERPILVSKKINMQGQVKGQTWLQFEFVPLPHPGRSGRAYWSKNRLKEIKQKAVELCQDRIGQAMAGRFPLGPWVPAGF